MAMSMATSSHGGPEPIVKTSDTSVSFKDVQLFCSICLVERSKYTCPRCNVHYCSLTCYKSERHLQCSEEFYKECVIRDLKQTERSWEDKRQMMDLLQKFESENTPPLLGVESDTPTLEERLAGLDIDRDEEEVWQRLTAEEKREFHAMIKSGTAGDLLEPHPPWWESIPKVSPVAGPNSLPQIPTDLPPLKSLVKAPSPYVQYSVFNVLCAYVYVVRLFNSEHRDLPLQASQAVLELALSLSKGAVFTSVHDAVTSPLSIAQQSRDLFNSHTFSLAVLKDILCLLGDKKSHDCHVTQALADLYALSTVAHKQIKSMKSGEGETRALWQAKKKLYFLLVWSSECVDVLGTLRPALELEIGTFQREQSAAISNPKSHDSHMTDAKVGVHEQSLVNQRLIEEL